MPCVVNLNNAPAQILPPTEISELTPSEDAILPGGAGCVTFTFQLCANPAAVAPNQVAIRVFWSAGGGVPLSQEVVLQPTGTCGVFDTCLGVYNSPTAAPPDECVVWDLSFAVPAGKNDVQVTAEEIGDPANPGTLTVWVAFK